MVGGVREFGNFMYRKEEAQSEASLKSSCGFEATPLLLHQSEVTKEQTSGLVRCCEAMVATSCPDCVRRFCHLSWVRRVMFWAITLQGRHQKSTTTAIQAKCYINTVLQLLRKSGQLEGLSNFLLVAFLQEQLLNSPLGKR